MKAIQMSEQGGPEVLHLVELPDPEPGPGDLLGRLEPGHPGCPVAACLHWGLRRGAVYLDPLLLVRPVRVRLLPLPG